MPPSGRKNRKNIHLSQKRTCGRIDKGARVVIFGHTHRCQLESIHKGIYANCGTWVDSATPTYIAYDTGKIWLREALNHKIIKEMAV